VLLNGIYFYQSLSLTLAIATLRTSIFHHFAFGQLSGRLDFVVAVVEVVVLVLTVEVVEVWLLMEMMVT
jgi:hypothetical protein